MSLETGRLALLIGQARDTCYQEIDALRSLSFAEDSDMEIAWHLSAIESALYHSLEQIVSVAAEFFPVSEEIAPWSPLPGVTSSDELIDAWANNMEKRAESLSRLYEKARKITLDGEVGESNISIDDLF